MSHLSIIIMTALILLGITVYVLDNDNGGVNGALLNGHERLKNEMRSYNYSTN